MAGQIVTLLFTDLVGSSALLQRLGDEGNEHMRQLHFGLLREAVKESGGEEVKNLGDGLMVVFESVTAATRCAIAMQRSIGRHNAGGGPQLGVRVGLHVGEPIREEGDFFGAAVVVAKRLCDAANAGQILASGLVRGLAASKSGFVFTSVGDVPLKGMDEPVPAFEVGWQEQGEPGWSASDGRTALIGRGSQLERLDAEMADVLGGRLRVVVLLGEAGVGKTRLAAEFVARRSDQLIALSARAYPLGATASLGLWVEALERTLRSFPPREVLELCSGHVGDLSAILPFVRAASGEDSSTPPAEPARISLLAGLASLLDRLSRRSPVVVTLDDVHLADGSSWEALNYLTRNLADARVLVVLVARPGELADHPMASEVVGALEQEGLLSRVIVDPFSTDEVREMAASLVKGPTPDALVEWLTERAQGSPLFVAGLVRALLEEGADLEHPSLISLPEDLAQRVAARLRVLDGPARAIVELLAVVERRSELGDLLRLTGQDLDPLADILERLQRVRLVSEIEIGRDLVYEIAHPLIQEAVYRQIGGARRRALHRHVARVLVAGGRYGAAASHVVRAANPGDDEAIETLCEAFRRAGAGEHHREALGLLDALLEMLPAGDRRWLQVLEAMPTTPDWVVDHRADANAGVGVRAMRRADQVLERSADVASRAAVKFSMGSLMTWGLCELESGRELVCLARDLFDQAGDQRSVLVATNELSYHAAMVDDGEAHERLAREVLAAGEATGDAVLQLQALCSLAWALSLSGRIELSLPILRRAVEIARQADKTYRLCYLLSMLASLESLLGWPGRLADLDAAREVHLAYRDTLLLDFTAQVAWQTGDLQGAVTAYLDQVAWDGASSTRRAFGQGMAVMALAEQGRHQDAAAIQQRAQAAFGGRSCWVLSRLTDWSGAVATSLACGPGDGIPPLASAAQDATAHGYWCWSRWMIVDLAEAAVYAGEAAAAALAKDLLDRDPCPPAGPSHDAARALVAGAASIVSGNALDAAESLGLAAEGFRIAGWTLHEGRALELLGTALARHDRARAITTLDAAAELFSRCGAVVRYERTAARLAGLGTKGRRKKTGLVGPGSLTAREREVAVLAATGSSAREIAEQLFIGERTVETHLANAYAKLGVASKVELVRRAHELGV